MLPGNDLVGHNNTINHVFVFPLRCPIAAGEQRCLHTRPVPQQQSLRNANLGRIRHTQYINTVYAQWQSFYKNKIIQATICIRVWYNNIFRKRFHIRSKSRKQLHPCIITGWNRTRQARLLWNRWRRRQVLESTCCSNWLERQPACVWLGQLPPPDDDARWQVSNSAMRWGDHEAERCSDGWWEGVCCLWW